MRLPRKWGRLLTLLVAAILVIGLVSLLLFLRSSTPPSPVTRANFQRIEVGMSQSDLRSLLGAPEYDATELGRINGPDSYSLNFIQSEKERRQSGYRDYRRQQWTSSECSIIVISDPERKVVCRYTREGQKPARLAFFRSWLPW
jgi:hypothetical protein